MRKSALGKSSPLTTDWRRENFNQIVSLYPCIYKPYSFCLFGVFFIHWKGIAAKFEHNFWECENTFIFFPLFFCIFLFITPKVRARETECCSLLIFLSTCHSLRNEWFFAIIWNNEKVNGFDWCNSREKLVFSKDFDCNESMGKILYLKVFQESSPFNIFNESSDIFTFTRGIMPTLFFIVLMFVYS